MKFKTRWSVAQAWPEMGSTRLSRRMVRAGLGLMCCALGLAVPAVALDADSEELLLSKPVSAMGQAPGHNLKGMTVPEALRHYQQSRRRWIEVDLTGQRLIAWEGGEQAYAIIVSAGTTQDPTLPGVFAVQSMHESTRMRGPGYDISNVPFAMFYDGNYAIHGAYWHQQFGTPVSRGCVNVAVDHAEWLFTWSAVGTPVVVHY